MPITFQVSPVERATAPFRMEMRRRASPAMFGRSVEAWGSNAPGCFLSTTKRHSLVGAVGLAFDQHYPLVLSPDDIWLCIAQAFALHVNMNAEHLRGKFVRHEGKARITIQRDDFIKGDPNNPWPEVFHEFSNAIAGYVGRQRDLVVCDFSTTGPCERAASEIALMDAMQNYFDYNFLTMCGIPVIRLEGTIDDWRNIRRRAQALEEYELSWWIRVLGPVIDRIVATMEGKIDQRFWRSLYKVADESGGPFLTGWINVLFPYVSDTMEGGWCRNPWIQHARPDMQNAMAGASRFDGIPVGASVAPLRWKCLKDEYEMELVGGFVGMRQDPRTLALRPAIGWAVRDAVQTPTRVPVGSSSPVEDPLDVRHRVDIWLRSGNAWLIAGRVSSSDSFTWDEWETVESLVNKIESKLCIGLRCVALGGPPVGTHVFVPAPGKIMVGIPVGKAADVETIPKPFRGDIGGTLDRLRLVPASWWDEIAEVLLLGFSKEDAVYVACQSADQYQRPVRATLVFGELTPAVNAEHVHAVKRVANVVVGVRGVKLATVGHEAGVCASVDMSASVEAERRASLDAMGVRPDEVGLYLVAT